MTTDPKPASLLAELLAGADTSAADALRTAAAALQAELGMGESAGYAPRGADVLATAPMPYAQPRGLGWLVLRLLSTEQAAIELWARATPYNYTDTRCEARLATCPLVPAANPDGQLVRDYVLLTLRRFVAEAQAHDALPKATAQA